jgi:hypothetical protein
MNIIKLIKRKVRYYNQDIQYYVHYYVSNKVSKFITSLKRLGYWIPIIWQDRDWDYWHLLNLIDKKLSRMQKEIDDFAVKNGQKRSKTIHKARQYLHKALNPEEHSGVEDYMEKKWGKIECYTSKPIHREGYGPCYKVLMRYEKQKDGDEKKVYKDLKYVQEQETKMRKQHSKEFFDYMQANYEEWWT